MGWANRRRRYTPIGVDIQESAVHAVQFVRRGGAYVLHAAGSEPIEAGEDPVPGKAAVLNALRTLLGAHAFAGKRAVGGLPAEAVDIRPIRLPPGLAAGDSPQFREALRLETRSCMLYDPQNAVIDYLPLPPNGSPPQEEGVQLLLIAARKEAAYQHLVLLKAAGLSCLHLDIRPCAALRLLPEGDAPVAVVDLGERLTCISLARGRNLFFSRVFKLGWGDLAGVVEKALDTSGELAGQILAAYGVDHAGRARLTLDAIAESGVVDVPSIPVVIFEICNKMLERFVQELRRTFEYLHVQQRGGAVTAVHLFGHAVPPHMETYLADRLGLPVVRLEAGLACRGSGAPQRRNASALVVAAGLALRGYS